MKILITILLSIAGIYTAIGLVFALFFVTRGVQAIDEDAQGMSWVLRLMLYPASVVLWIFLLPKWLNAKKSAS